jgi:ribosome-associated toxin RatA of RatAB toxin-antitoxin module
MASAEKVEIFDVSADKIYKVLTDYESYPDFMDGVKSVNIVSRDGSIAKVEYNINIIKKFSYVLTSEEIENEKVGWSFDSGDLFSSNNGSWNLKDNGDGTTEVTYKVDIEFKVKVPGMISRKLVSSNLPSMMRSVLKKAKSL